MRERISLCSMRTSVNATTSHGWLVMPRNNIADEMNVSPENERIRDVFAHYGLAMY